MCRTVGYYNNASAPNNRGFDEFYGYWEVTPLIGTPPDFLDICIEKSGIMGKTGRI